VRLNRIERLLVVVLLGVSVVGAGQWVAHRSDHEEGAPARVPANDDWPEVAALVRTWAAETGPYDAYLCTAAFVARDVLVTATHCVEGYTADDLMVVVDQRDLCTAGPAELVPVREVRGPVDGIVALAVDRAEGGPWFERAAPAAAIGARGTVLGWGAVHAGGRRPCELAESHPRLRPIEECREMMADHGIELAPGELCAGDAQGDACEGDSGGPLVVDTADGPRLIGVVSRGPACLTTEWGGVYAGVGAVEEMVADG
jgi:secreted trypsin-like serine protease